MENSVIDYFDTLEKYKHLKKAEVQSIPDEELEDAVMSWMWSLFDGHWSNKYEAISALAKPCQNVYSCRTVIDEVNNGGLNQLFFNSTGQFAEMSIDGFSAINSPNLSGIMKKAVQLYRNNKVKLEKYSDGTSESFSDSYEEKIFDELDKAFFNECDSINIVSYIRSHSEYFGD